MKSGIATFLNHLFHYKKFITAHEQLEMEAKQLQQQLQAYELGWPPGHFYSPIPDLNFLREHEAEVWSNLKANISGVQLNEATQLQRLQQLSVFRHQLPWGDEQQEQLRFYYKNPNFTYGEAIVLYAMLRQCCPKKVIEIGSGFSSCVLLDTNEFFFNNQVALTFIEPYPKLLLSLFKPGDENRVNIIDKRLQQVPLQTFTSLAAGDILFIDSTHVAKTGSDVNYIFFEILPVLQPGVYIHFHDIYFPFEYPKKWVFEGRFWNEAYLLRAFLQYNNAFEIVLFHSFLEKFHAKAAMEFFPLFENGMGSSIWLRKR